jgi:hypothetical protein
MSAEVVVRSSRFYAIVATVEAVCALLSGALTIWLILSSIRAAQWAERTYGHNVDSGALEWGVAIFVLAPLTLALALASWSLWRRWRARWWLQGGVVLVCVAALLALVGGR